MYIISRSNYRVQLMFMVLLWQHCVHAHSTYCQIPLLNFRVLIVVLNCIRFSIFKLILDEDVCLYFHYNHAF
uniref:Putative secreted protein n=1 Tax=Xenopsylla cheopis TaxID=163159 RepID=A0A6M2E253_XENCH